MRLQVLTLREQVELRSHEAEAAAAQRKREADEAEALRKRCASMEKNARAQLEKHRRETAETEAQAAAILERQQTAQGEAEAASQERKSLKNAVGMVQAKLAAEKRSQAQKE